jgi:hypothetical protein
MLLTSGTPAEQLSGRPERAIGIEPPPVIFDRVFCSANGRSRHESGHAICGPLLIAERGFARVTW